MECSMNTTYMVHMYVKGGNKTLQIKVDSWKRCSGKREVAAGWHLMYRRRDTTAGKLRTKNQKVNCFFLQKIAKQTPGILDLLDPLISPC